MTIRSESIVFSSFANFGYSYLPEYQTLVDIVCGNGRDTAFFEKKYDRVYGYDFVSNPNYLGDKSHLVIEDVEEIINYDPRVQLDKVEVNQYEHGLSVRVSVLYTG